MDPTDVFGQRGTGQSSPIPSPNVTIKMAGTESDWIEEEIRGVICNPIYAGVGPFPAFVADEVWVRCAATLIANEGAEQFLVNLLNVLRTCFPTDRAPSPNSRLNADGLPAG